MPSIAFTYLFSFSNNYLIGGAAVLLDRLTYVILLLILVACLSFGKNRFHTVMLLFLSSASAWFVAELLKFTFHTARPSIALHITPLITVGDYSFPSEHAAVFSAIAVAMYFVNRRAGIALGILALLVGLSRVILGVHYPTDVIGGYVIGIVTAILFVKLFKKL